MKRAKAEIVIDAPIERVWALYEDIAGTTRWVPFVEEVLYVSGPLEVGMVYRERTRLGRIRAVNEWRIAEVERPARRVETSSSMGMESRLIIKLRPEDGGTRLRQEAEFRSKLPRPLGWFQETLFRTVSRRAMESAVRGAKQELERPAAVGG